MNHIHRRDIKHLGSLIGPFPFSGVILQTPVLGVLVRWESRALLPTKRRSYDGGSVTAAMLLWSNLPAFSTAVRADVMPLLERSDKPEAGTLLSLMSGLRSTVCELSAAYISGDT